jgi:hypothetical protein
MKNKKSNPIPWLIVALFALSCNAHADDSFMDWILNWNHMDGVKPIDNAVYRSECASCHFAYQPGLLPAKSWQKILTPEALHNHFGEVADLDKETLQIILDYAVENSAEKSYYKRSRTIAAATKGIDPPMRITDVRYIKRKHHEIPASMITGNKGVKSLSNCMACHTQAEKGIYDADTVKIPNFPNY